MARLIGARLGGSSGGLSSSAGIRVISPNALAGGGVINFTRAQLPTVLSTALGADDTTWQQFAADTPRYTTAARALLINDARTNFCRNPRCEGGALGVFGSGGTMPTLGAGVNTIAGTTLERLPNQTINGIEGVVFRLTGTPSATSYSSTNTFDNGTHYVPGAGVSVTTSIFCALLDGSWTNINAIELIIAGLTGVSNMAGAPSTPTRYSLTTTGNGSSFGRSQFRMRAVNTVDAINATFFLGWPQVEEGDFATTPILPATGTTAVTTRGQDVLTAAYTTHFPTNVGSILATVIGNHTVPSGQIQTIAAVNDGTASNVIHIYIDGTTATVRVAHIIGGVTTASASLGAYTANTIMRIGLTFDVLGIVGNLNGGTNQTVTGRPPGLTTFRIGGMAPSSNPLFGRIIFLDTYPYVIPPANLPAAVAAMPV